MIRHAALAAFALLQGAPATPSYSDGKGLVRVEGARRINLVCAGAGTPTVVLTAGAGAPASTWRAVQPLLAARMRSCAWDRAGFGISDASPARQTAGETARDLSRTLAAARVSGPLILVGHSIGAYETLLLADRMPARVAGIVLVDPSTPDMFRATGEDAAAVMARYAAPFRACAEALRYRLLPPSGGAVRCRGGDDPARFDTASSFFDAAGESARLVVRPARSYGAMPLVVLSPGAPPHPSTPFRDGQAALARLSSRGTHEWVPDSGHMMQRDRPDAVAAAIVRVLGRMSLSRHTTTR